MNREEMLAKLKAIEPTSFPTAATMDMGLEFEVLNSTGATTILGGVGDWPFWKFPRLTIEQVVLFQKKIEYKTLSLDDFVGPLKYFVEKILYFHNDANLSELFEELPNFSNTDTKSEVFIYCDVASWDLEIEFFDTEQEIKNDFFKNYEIEMEWDDMDDDTLEAYCEWLEQYGEGVPFNSTDDE